MGTELYTQAKRHLKVVTPLPTDFLLLTALTGHEAVSQLFNYQLDVIVENRKLDQKADRDPVFDNVLGQPVIVEMTLPSGQPRFFHGICHLISQGARDHEFTAYRLEVVPELWLLAKRMQSRIFQHITVPDLLKLLKDEWKLDADGFGKLRGPFEPRDYVVQYRETDLNFVSRLMEEEGIYYYFQHSDCGHNLVLANPPTCHPPMPEQCTITFDPKSGTVSPDDRISDWRKLQELRSSKFTLWDHCFELPHKHLEAERNVQAMVNVGKVIHQIKHGSNGRLELMDWPGKYAQRFDGVNAGGGDQSDNLQRIFEDNKRTVEIRMQEEAAPGVVTWGTSCCRQFVPGHKFTLKGHLHADGEYLLTTVHHTAHNPSYRSGGGGSLDYTNTFTCLPLGLPYRPPRMTRRPVVAGTQTAVVVGPPGEEIFTDKYGRVKVQFHWDREGKHNTDSSCWVRVGQLWAGKRWGASFWPRIGQEVIVDFVEGDPDQPLIIGSVYNAEQPPPYLGDGKNPGPDPKHPNDNKVSGIKSNTTLGGQGFNEWRFDDTKDKQQIFIHAERDLDTRVKNECRELVLSSRHLIVGWEKEGQKGGDQRELVNKDKHLTVKGNHVEHIQGDMQLLVGGGEGAGNQDIVIKKTKKELIEEDNHLHVKGQRCEQVDGDQSLILGGARDEKLHGGHYLEAEANVHIKAGQVMVLEAGLALTLKVGGNFIDINPSGVFINGIPTVMINSGGAAAEAPDANPSAPEDAKEAKPTKPAVADDAKTGYKSAP